jgi:hypothetical protein
MKNTNKYLLTLFLTSLVTVGLAGCSENKSANSSASDSDTPNLVDETSQQETERVIPSTANALPQGDPNTSLDHYKKLTSNTDVMFVYYALSAMPVNYDNIAQGYSQDYRDTNDDFKKQDILKALKPRIDQEITLAKSARYLKIKQERFRLDKYDFQAKGFPQSAISNQLYFGEYYSGPSYKVLLTNSEDFKLLKVADEAKARVIENKRSKNEDMNLVFYVYAQDVDPNERFVKGQIMKVALQDKNGTELFSQ